MYGRTRKLYAALECALMHFETIETKTTKRGDQRRVDVEHTVFKAAAKGRGEHIEKAREHDRINALALEQCNQRVGIALTVGVVARTQHGLGDPGVFGAREGISPR